MKNNSFIDSNIFVYAALKAGNAKAKHSAAIELLQNCPNSIISTQVLNEFYNALLKHGVSDEKIKLYAREIIKNVKNGCTKLYTEDMQHKQTIENQLTIINPFVQ